MRSVVVASVISCALLSSTTAQTKPDFSGTWRFDPTRSDSATYPELSRPVTLVITQTATAVRIDTTRKSGTTSEVAKFGSNEPLTVLGAATARWRGETLLVDIIRDIQGQSVTVHQEMTLSADGRELVVESTVNVQHGYSVGGAKVYGAGKDTFIRAQ